MMRQGSAGGDDLCATDDEAFVGFLLDLDENINLFVRQVPINWRMDNCMVNERNSLTSQVVPAIGIRLVLAINFVGSQSTDPGSLVVRCSAHPAIGDSGPLGDCIARCNLFL